MMWMRKQRGGGASFGRGEMSPERTEQHESGAEARPQQGLQPADPPERHVAWWPRRPGEPARRARVDPAVRREQRQVRAAQGGPVVTPWQRGRGRGAAPPGRGGPTAPGSLAASPGPGNRGCRPLVAEACCLSVLRQSSGQTLRGNPGAPGHWPIHSSLQEMFVGYQVGP